jgi:type IV pilus assembly protein PilM
MVTLDIEDTGLRLMVVNGKKVKLAVSLPLEPGLVKDGLITNKEAVAQRIKGLLSAHSVTERQVVVGVSGIHSLYRIARLPKLSASMVADAAKHEMERMMPVPLDEIYTSWQAIPVSDVETAVPLVGTPRETVDAILKTLQMAGLSCKTMDIKPLAVARVIDQREAAIVNVEPASFDIVVVANGIPEIVRSLAFSSPDISDDEKIDEVKEELERTIGFYNSNRPTNKVHKETPIFISGTQKSLVAGNLDYRERPLPQLLSYPDEFDIDEYVTNVGLALKQAKAGKMVLRANLNTVPMTYLPKRVPVLQVVTIVFVGIAIAVLVPTVMSAQKSISQTSAMQNEVNKLQIEVERSKVNEAKIEKLTKELDEIAEERDKVQAQLAAYSKQRRSVNDELSMVTSLMAGTIYPETIKYGNSWSIVGVAPNTETILEYVRLLRDSGQFSEVLLSSMQEMDFDEWKFIITLK